MTSRRLIGSISRLERDAAYFEWRIQDFLSQLQPYNAKSPKFSFCGSTWFLGLHEVAPSFEISLSRCDTDSDTSVKTTLSFFIMDLGGILRNIRLGDIKATEYKFDDRNSTYSCLFKYDRDDFIRWFSELLPHGNLIIICNLMNRRTPPAPAEASHPPRNFTGMEKLLSRYGELFASKKGCDVTIKVKDKEFQAHRTILMAQSPVFEAMFDSDMSEARTGVVNVPDCDPDSFGNFLQYLYTAKFEGVSPEHARHLYVTADKYDVQALKSYCGSYMMENLTVENVCDVISLADHYQETDLMSCAKRFFNKNISEVLSTAQCEMLFKANYTLAKKLLQEMVKDQHSGCNVQRKRCRS